MTTISPTADPAVTQQLLRTALDLSPAGMLLLEPLTAAGEVGPVDFRYLYLNPAAQQRLQLPAQPAATYRQQPPPGLGPASFAQLRSAYLASEQATEAPPPLGTTDQLVAHRRGDLLLVSLPESRATPPHRKAVGPARGARPSRQAFLLQLSDQLLMLDDPSAIQYQAACALGTYLGASRVGYAEDQHDDQTIVVMHNYTAGVPGLEGRYTYDEFGPELLREFRMGRMVVRPDIAHDPSLTAAEKAAHAALQLGATVNVPLRRGGQLLVVLFAHHTHAHTWTAAELALITEVAERTWSAVARARAEESLRQREERFRAIVTQANVGIAETVAGCFTYVNDWFCQLTGYRAEELLGQPVAAITHPDEAARDTRLLQNLYDTGQPFTVDKRYVRPDGSVVWVLNTVTPVRNAQGQVTGGFAASIDVTGRKRAEERLQKTLSIPTVGVLFFDLEGRIHDANEAFERMSGYSRQALVSGQVLWSKLTPPEFMPVTFISRDELLQKGQNTPYEKQYIRPDGSRWWGLFAGKRLSEGECVEFVLDITDSKRDARQLREFNEQLTRTNADLDNFIYTASHDLKAPIANIEGLLLALRHELPAAGRVGDVPLMLQLMQEAVERFQRTIGHLTDISRLQKEHAPAPAAVNLAAVVAEVSLDLQPLLTQTSGQLRVEVPTDFTVVFSEKNLRSVVYNLLSNALKYRHPERSPRVLVRAEQAEDYQVLRVQDNGLGLDLVRGRDKLFAMFQRLHTHVEGTGIGLYMVKKMVENAGGRIEVHSQPGQGATFEVYFPVAAPA